MAICWGVFSTKSKKALKTGWLITAGVLAFYVGVIQPRERRQLWHPWARPGRGPEHGRTAARRARPRKRPFLRSRSAEALLFFSLVTPSYFLSPSGLNLRRKFVPHPRSLHKTRQAASLPDRSDGFPGHRNDNHRKRGHAQTYRRAH